MSYFPLRWAKGPMSFKVQWKQHIIFPIICKTKLMVQQLVNVLRGEHNIDLDVDR
jgi:hypothetical protein